MEEIHAHEAAHGWYGDGVRIACWEDFVSEGTANYLAARSLGAAGVDLWAGYECSLKTICEQGGQTIALPDETCNEIDILNHPIWSLVPYIKGAYFLKDVADLLTPEVVDEALAEFYVANKNKAARMQALIDHIKTKTDAAGGAAVDALVTDWLKTEACPVAASTLVCPN